MSVSEPITAEVAGQLRDDSRQFVKLDLSYLAAAGAIVTALKINRYEMIDMVAALRTVLPFYVCLLAYDAFVSFSLSREWVAAKLEWKKRPPSVLMFRLHSLQPLFHVLFLTWFMAYGVGYSGGVVDARSEIATRVSIEDEVERFSASEKRVPNSFEELKLKRPRVVDLVNRLGEEPFRYEKLDANSYRLLFAGPDKLFGTADDDVSTPDFRLRPAWELFQKRHESQSTSK